VQRSIASLYAVVVIIVSSGLAIAPDRVFAGALAWLPELLAILGAILLLAACASIVAESRLSNRQIQEEIRLALSQP
jgi:hypothetical protein